MLGQGVGRQEGLAEGGFVRDGIVEGERRLGQGVVYQ